MHISAGTLDDLLRDLYPKLLAPQPMMTASRGNFTEISGCLLSLENPRARLSRTESKGKIYSALGEFFWYLSAGTSLDFIDYYVPNIYRQESDDGTTVRSGYGERLFNFRGFNQVEQVLSLLQRKPGTRRAVIQLFDASDLAEDFLSIPCTCTLQFLRRDGELDLIVSMRSNDAFLGLPHDVFAFTMIQELFARALQCEVGQYKHFAGSMHLYERHRESAESFLAEGWQATTAMPPMPVGDPWPFITAMQSVEKRIRTGESIDFNELNDEYWMDVARLLAAYRASKERDVATLKALRAALVNKTYGIFVDARIDRIDQ